MQPKILNSIHMKKLFLSLLLLLPVMAVAQSIEDASIHEFNSAFFCKPTTLTFEFKIWHAGLDPYHGGRTEGNVKAGDTYTTYKITNKDFCKYTILGLRGVIEISKESEEEYPNQLLPDGKRTVQYRGVVPDKKFAPDKATYALPCHSPNDIQMLIKDIQIAKQDVRLLIFEKQANDTVYAMRGGVVCLFSSKNRNSILINHADETFSLYYNIDVFSVKPGDKILAGQPIGLCYSDIHTAFLYLDKDKLKSKEEQMGFPYKSFIPVLYTEKGLMSLSDPGRYSLKSKDLPVDIITQDMSKSDKKKYINTHSLQ